MREIDGETQAKLQSEREKEFVSTTYIDLTRHGNRFGGPIKVTLNKLGGELLDVDDKQGLTPRGRENSQKFGAESYEDVSLVHPRGGDELRHGQSGVDILAGSGKFGEDRETPASVLYQTKDKEGKPVEKVRKIRQGKQMDYASAGLKDVLKRGVKLIIDTLQKNVDNLSKEDQERFKTDKEYRALLREQAQVVGLKEVLESNDPEFAATVKALAENTAYELMHDVELSRRGIKGDDAKAITLVGSGLFAESMYKYALVVEDPKTGEKKTGFDKVDEIGGFTKQASAFRLKLTRDNSKGDARKLEDFDKDTAVECEFIGDPERAKLFEGKRVYLDWDIVKQLAAKAELRFNK
jgi:hypothetical protein